jgi:HNH endonuclease
LLACRCPTSPPPWAPGGNAPPSTATPNPNRLRPLVLDLDRYRALPSAGAASIDGTRLDRTSTDRVLCDAAIHRVLTHGRSAILDYGTTTRTIPAPLYNTLIILDRHCRFPGCDRPAAWCEGHHIHPWHTGGPTQLANLVLLCTRHHHLLHRPHWHTKLLPDTTLEITDPTGHTRTSHPPAGRAPPLTLRE